MAREADDSRHSESSMRRAAGLTPSTLRQELACGELVQGKSGNRLPIDPLNGKKAKKGKKRRRVGLVFATKLDSIR